MLPLGKQTLPLCHLSKILKQQEISDNGCDTSSKIGYHLTLIVKNGNEPAAIEVDEIVSKQKVVIKNLGRYLKNIPAVSGASIQGDGSVMLMLEGSVLCNIAKNMSRPACYATR